MIMHPIPPLYNENSKILILGSFPSVKSREEGFFYGHKQNRFWKVVSAVFEKETPQTVEEKRDFLHSCGIAVWDVLAACEIKGSADSSIKNEIPNDLSEILNNADIKAIFTNGKTADKYFNKYQKNVINREAVCLPSTSPANAAKSIDMLIESWKIIKYEGI